MRLALVTAAAVSLLAVPQTAAARQYTVVGAGTSHSCIAQAQDPNVDLRQAQQGCTDALKYQAMSTEDRVATLINRGIIRARMTLFKDALTDYDEALSMDANAPAGYLNRSATLLGLKRYGDAKRDADKAIELHATPLEVAYFNRAVAEEGLGEIKAAYEDYKQALVVKPDFQPAKDELTRFKVTSGGS